METGTREKLMSAFFELGKEKPYSKITVTQIVERVGITRKTFYYHFEDIFALGEAAIEDKMERIFEESIHMPTSKESLKHFLKCLGGERDTINCAKNSPYYTVLVQIMVRKLQAFLERILDEKGVLNQMTRREAVVFVRVLTYSVAGLGLEDLIKNEKEAEQTLEQLLSLFRINLD